MHSVLGLLIALLFLSLPCLLIVGGIKSIIEKESIPPTIFMFPRKPVTGVQAILSGIFYLLLGIMILSMYASAYFATACFDTTGGLCGIRLFLRMPFELISEFLNRI